MTDDPIRELRELLASALHDLLPVAARRLDGAEESNRNAHKRLSTMSPAASTGAQPSIPAPPLLPASIRALAEKTPA